MEKYRRVEKDEEAGESPANQIRVTATGRIRAYVSYATKILEDETNEDGVVLLGLGNAIGKALTVSELLRRNVSGLHQVTELGSVEIKDRWEPLEEGLDPIETVRNVSSISVHLSKKQLNENAAGYQPPIERESEEQVQLLIEAMDAPYKRPSAGGPRGRGRRGSRKPSGRPRRDDKPGENAYNVNVGDTVEEDANGNGDEESDTKDQKPYTRRRSRKNVSRRPQNATDGIPEDITVAGGAPETQGSAANGGGVPTSR